MEQPRLDVDAANFRLMIITSFLVGATMILLSSNISLIRQSTTSGSLGLVEDLLIVSIALSLFSSLIMLFMGAIILVSMYLGVFTFEEKLQRISTARTLLGASSILIPASFGSMFLVSLGLSSPLSRILGGIGYASGIAQALLRNYYLGRHVHPRMGKAPS
jgi:hypothetical protein